MLVLCWSTVYDAGPVLDQHWVNVSFFLGPTNRIHQPNVGPMLVQRLRRWSSIGPTCRICWDMYGVEGCNVNHFPHTYEPGVVSDGKSAERPWSADRAFVFTDSFHYVRSPALHCCLRGCHSKRDLYHNAASLLAQRRRRWANIEPTLCITVNDNVPHPGSW